MEEAEHVHATAGLRPRLMHPLTFGSGLRNVADPMAPWYIDWMIEERIPAVKDLTPAERLQLAAELWGSVAESQDQIPVANGVRRLLDARFAHYQKHPETAKTWDELKR